MGTKTFKDLIVWQKSMDLTVEVYKTIKNLPKDELYSLADQMKRAVVSIPSNIAEGQQRTSIKEFRQFLSIAKGSLGELETQLMICERLDYLSTEQIRPMLDKCNEIGRMLNGLINNLQNKE